MALPPGTTFRSEYLRNPDQVAFYGMMNVLPAAPIRWSLEDAEPADRLLPYGLARWYHRPLEASLVPIDVITGVLRTRRPYYYHHILAHALVKTICVQRVLPPGIVADAIVGKLAAFYDLILDGYRLRCRYLPRLKTDRKSTRLNSSHLGISYAVFCLKK